MRAHQVHKTRNFKHDAVYREKNPSTVLGIERRERLWSVRLKQDGRIWASMNSLA